MAQPVEDGFERFHPADVREWRAWLDANHTSARGIWFVSWKKSAGLPTVSYDEAVCEALAYGWIDNKGGALDDQRSMLRFVPRRAKSGWSLVNKERLVRLQAEGRMHPAGAAVLAAAIEDGSWTLLDDVDRLVVPDDLAVGLRAHPPALENWDTLSRTVRRATLFWIAEAKRAETRAQRIEATAVMTAKGERPR